MSRTAGGLSLTQPCPQTVSRKQQTCTSPRAPRNHAQSTSFPGKLANRAPNSISTHTHTLSLCDVATQRNLPCCYTRRRAGICGCTKRRRPLQPGWTFHGNFPENTAISSLASNWPTLGACQNPHRNEYFRKYLLIRV